jgi:hypothetical protein
MSWQRQNRAAGFGFDADADQQQPASCLAGHRSRLKSGEEGRAVDDRSLALPSVGDREPAFERKNDVDDSPRQHALAPMRMGDAQLPYAVDERMQSVPGRRRPMVRLHDRSAPTGHPRPVNQKSNTLHRGTSNASNANPPIDRQQLPRELRLAAREGAPTFCGSGVEPQSSDELAQCRRAC